MAEAVQIPDSQLLSALETICAQDAHQQTIMSSQNMMLLQNKAIMAMLTHATQRAPAQLDGFRQNIMLHLGNILTIVRRLQSTTMSGDVVLEISNMLGSLLPDEMYHDPHFTVQQYEVILGLLQVCIKKDINITVQQNEKMLSFLLRQLADVHSHPMSLNLIASLWEDVAERSIAGNVAQYATAILDLTERRIGHASIGGSNVDLEVKLINVLTSMTRKDAIMNPHLENVMAFSKRILNVRGNALSDVAMKLLVPAFTKFYETRPEEEIHFWFKVLKDMKTVELGAVCLAFHHMSSLIQTQFTLLHEANSIVRLRNKRKKCYKIMLSCSKLLHKRLRRLGKNTVVAQMDRLKLFYRYEWCRYEFLYEDFSAEMEWTWVAIGVCVTTTKCRRMDDDGIIVGP